MEEDNEFLYKPTTNHVKYVDAIILAPYNTGIDLGLYRIDNTTQLLKLPLPELDINNTNIVSDINDNKLILTCCYFDRQPDPLYTSCVTKKYPTTITIDINHQLIAIEEVKYRGGVLSILLKKQRNKYNIVEHPIY
jgi:hypothetical protein